MGKKLTQHQKDLIRAMPSFRTSREVAKLVGCGHTAVAEFRQTMKAGAAGPRPAPRPPAAPAAPAEPREADDTEWHRLNAACCDAETHEELREATVALQRFVDPKFAYCLDHGMSVTEALSETYAVPYDLLGTPLDLAYVARMATDYLGCYEREPGESQEHFEAEMRKLRADSHGRAIALLEAAAKLLRNSDPETFYADLFGKRDEEARPFYADWKEPES